jgi:hypothetical protein
MNKLFFYFIAFLLFASFDLFAFENLLFSPLNANHLEAHISTFYQPQNDKLRLDIGHTLDLMNVYSDNNSNIRIGGDFFILSRLRSVGKMKFPVETADYYFGLNSSGVFHIAENNFSYRLRIAHISSHLIDGYTIDNEFIQEPFVYSREFVDLILAFDSKYYVRPYLGGTIIFSTIPKDVNLFVPQIGFDFNYPIHNKFSILGGYDFKLVGNNNSASIGNNSAQAGILYKLSNTTGLSFNFYHQSGYSIHGMFYNQKENYWGYGIQFNY